MRTRILSHVDNHDDVKLDRFLSELLVAQFSTDWIIPPSKL